MQPSQLGACTVEQRCGARRHTDGRRGNRPPKHRSHLRCRLRWCCSHVQEEELPRQVVPSDRASLRASAWLADLWDLARLLFRRPSSRQQIHCAGSESSHAYALLPLVPVAHWPTNLTASPLHSTDHERSAAVPPQSDSGYPETSELNSLIHLCLGSAERSHERWKTFPRSKQSKASSIQGVCQNGKR